MVRDRFGDLGIAAMGPGQRLNALSGIAHEVRVRAGSTTPADRSVGRTPRAVTAFPARADSSHSSPILLAEISPSARHTACSSATVRHPGKGQVVEARYLMEFAHHRTPIGQSCGFSPRSRVSI